MDMTQLQQMALLTRMLFEKESERLRPLIARERACRQDLARLDQAAAEAARHYAEDPRLRASGAELAWKSWTAGTRSRLNVELARAIALRRHATERVQQAFGRDQSMQALLDATRSQAMRDRARQRDTRLLEGELLKICPRGGP